ncbi:hypothetical protein OAO63_02505 [Nitrosopumilus sp.]|jgi:hypothetical protein|nr:hypothetical protein [Nitrosopumilus sp.]
MKTKSKGKLAIFDTFKTKNSDLTGEAKRQRSIIIILGSNVNPSERTRTGISQKIAKKQEITWKNIYSGIFRDLDEILLPMGIAEEDGRLPLKRGPKALQEKGIPYYHLTKKGILVGLAINGIENLSSQLKEFFMEAGPKEKEFEKILTKFMTNSPNFTYSIFQKYVKAFCEDKINELLPFDLSKLKDLSDENLIIQKEVLVAFLKLTNQEKKEASVFLEKIA